MFYNLSRTNSKNVQKYLGSIFNFIKGQMAGSFIFKDAMFNNYCIAMFMDGLMLACDEKEFEYFDELENYKMENVDIGADYYKFLDGYIYAKNFNEHKLLKKLNQLSNILLNKIGNKVLNIPYTKKEELSKFDNNSFSLLKSLFEKYINTVSSQNTNIDNLTLNEYLQLQFAIVTVKTMQFVVDSAKNFNLESILNDIFK